MGVPAFLLTKGAIGNSAAVFLMIGIMLPFFFFAMFERDGQPAEKILRNFLRAKLWPGTRPYKTENLYKYLNEEGGRAFVGQEKTQAGAGCAKGRKPGSREAYGRKTHNRNHRETYRGKRKVAR
ncbi:hypothetical protein FACS189490_04290 [Clostridia bacterium]|nr:hypothetical protein FACS189490_04290 [Clostridia bacterium]